MTVFYKDGGFYHQDDSSGLTPDGAISVSEQDYISLLDGQAQGKQIVANAKGYPILTEPQPSVYHTWDGTKWAISLEQQAVKKAEDIAKVREAINALRDSKINGGVYVEAVGKWIDTDATAERNILSVKASYDLFGDMEIAWTCADNSILMLTKDKLLLIWQALMAAKTSNHANALRHKAAVEQSNDPLAYDYSDGWSKTYEDYLNEQN
ncbi:DUF4376 domain-containing protein [Mannheimia granulomatis]|uniref:Tail assembly protein n=1 Tax=Mannheimia granulomatis TaxID=85402 RepID=A0A011NAN2_9PAST|nr:DUF4376 domain-containing protein [Mannheimia granulomatis]EXI61667.1 tail assembly protein [Mannheimia granulomatis]